MEMYNAFNHTQFNGVNTSAQFDARGAIVNTAAEGATASHSFIGAKNARITLEAGFTTVRNVGASNRNDIGLAQAIRDAGIRDYSIFLDEETGTLFAVQKVATNNTTAELRKTDLMKRWWAHMADIMETNPDCSPVARPLTEVFHLD